MQENEIMAFMPQKELSKIKSDLEFIKEKLDSKNQESFSEQFIESKKVPKLLGVCQRTWQGYRDNKDIPFIQFGSKIWVKRSDLENFLNKYYVTK